MFGGIEEEYSVRGHDCHSCGGNNVIIHSSRESSCISSNHQGMSLTVKDLIAMSRVKDCLSGALLFVKEVVMMSIVASQLDMI